MFRTCPTASAVVLVVATVAYHLVASVPAMAESRTRTAARRSRAPSKSRVRPGDVLEVTESTWLRNAQGRSLNRDLELGAGTLVTAEATDHEGAWILVQDREGEVGWITASECMRLRRASRAREGDELSRRAEFDAGTMITMRKTSMLRAGPGAEQPATFRARRGSELKVLRESFRGDARWVLAVHESGSWGWVPAGRVFTVRATLEKDVPEGPAQPAPDEPAGRAGLYGRFTANAPIASQNSPSYEAKLVASFDQPLSRRLSLGLVGEFSYLHQEGQYMDGDQSTERVGYEFLGRATTHLTPYWKVSLGAGYAVKETAALGDPLFLSATTGPLGQLKLSGKLGKRVSLYALGEYIRALKVSDELKGKVQPTVLSELAVKASVAPWLGLKLFNAMVYAPKRVTSFALYAEVPFLEAFTFAVGPALVNAGGKSTISVRGRFIFSL